MNMHTTITASQELLLIPMSQLRPSARNVRKTGGTSIPELASSIARVGLLQNLTVIACDDGEHYEVVAGARRLAALKLLAKKKRLPSAHEVPCLVVPDAAARTASLTENVQREAMHPADQFEAFQALIEEGRPIEDIAADFGVTPPVVQRRLKLANVSPRLLADYRADAVTLDQLMALAITDDHAAQETAFYESPEWQRSPHALREHLTERDIDGLRDPLARFVGVAAYEAAGGTVRRDLFSEDAEQAYLTDAELLDRLAREKLAASADDVRAEGWAWVDVVPRIMPADLSVLHRVRPDRRKPNAKEAKRIAKLEARQQAIEDKLEGGDAAEIAEGKAQTLCDESDKLDAELEAIEQSLMVFSPDVLSVAGAVVTVDHAGEIAVHRGLLREADTEALRQVQEQGRHTDGAVVPKTQTMADRTVSAKLARQLSAHRTAALQAELARQPGVALVAVVHRLVLHTFYDDRHTDTALQVSCTPQDALDRCAPDLPESRAVTALADARQVWMDELPVKTEGLFAALQALSQDDLLSLLAVCVAGCIDAVSPHETDGKANELASALGLDMAKWWTATAAGYFAQVSKARVLEAVQCIAPDQVRALGLSKKPELVAAAERLAAGTGWLPAMLRS
ncbi:MAG: chromosome partitioning protein ParB [Hydrocarboniphaga sp.]|uniref:ParB/RepB/Spo0J family partition protein n=1 Tax=Hydrocarboniphaga sp. TaxID=2033016 RepID=UPI002616C525|nr:ParB/RepB/Spo0J family partition protein [Hydrocarboniphaga sp.]MDB5971119.1 chromosome partitioning protein ParB [Hydrocarboniphaga sp.]